MKSKTVDFFKDDYGNVNISYSSKMKFMFLINFEGIDIPKNAFRNYKIYNDGEELIFETSFLETYNMIINPIDFFKILTVSVCFIDATGHVISEWKFDIKGMSFENEGDYSKNEFMTYNLKFEINKKTFKTKSLI